MTALTWVNHQARIRVGDDMQPFDNWELYSRNPMRLVGRVFDSPAGLDYRIKTASGVSDWQMATNPVAGATIDGLKAIVEEAAQ